MLETWDWYVDRFRDAAVLDELRIRKFSLGSPAMQVRGEVHSAIVPHEIPYSSKEISESLGRSEESVIKSLKRLGRRGRVEKSFWGWTFKE